MKNINLMKEIDNNKGTNVVFTRQSARDLKKVAYYIQEKHPNDLLIEFSSFMCNNLAYYLRSYPKDNIMIWRDYIAEQIIGKLSEKSQKDINDISYKIKGHLTDKAIVILQEKAVLLKEKKAFSLLGENSETPFRIHFIMNGLNDDVLCQAVNLYLKENVHQPAMIYTSSDIYLEKEGSYSSNYDYLVFDEYQDGVASQYRKRKQKIIR